MVLEDTAALLGIVIAAAGLVVAHWLNAPAFDALASIVIGLLLHVDLDVAVDPSASAVDVSRRIEAAVREKHPRVHRVSVRFPPW